MIGAGLWLLSRNSAAQGAQAGPSPPTTEQVLLGPEAVAAVFPLSAAAGATANITTPADFTKMQWYEKWQADQAYTNKLRVEYAAARSPYESALYSVEDQIKIGELSHATQEYLAPLFAAAQSIRDQLNAVSDSFGASIHAAEATQWADRVKFYG